MTYFFKKIFGENGDITQIPTNDQGDGNVSYEKGWGEGYELDPSMDPDEARNLSRTNFNGLFFNITSALQQFQKYGVNPYITASDNGGEPFAYPEGGMCSYTDPTTGEFGIYRSTINDNTTYPSVNGYTNNHWQKIWDATLDTIKSNRLRNAILNMPILPYLDIDSVNQLGTVTIPEGMRILFSKGFENDHTLKSEIITYINNISEIIDISNIDKSFCIFATSTSSILVINSYNYLGYSNVTPLTEDLLPDVYYYFDTSLNTWMIKEEESSDFTPLEYSLCLVAKLNNINGEWSLSLSDILEINQLFNYEVKEDNNLLDGINYDLETTNFCVNKCNLDSSNNPNFMYSDSQITNKTVDVFQKNASNGTVTASSGFSNIKSGWVQGNISLTTTAMVSSGTSNAYTLTYKLNSPIKMLASTSQNPIAKVSLDISSIESHYIYNKNNDWYYDAHVITYNTFVGTIYFTDGTSYEFLRTDARWSSYTWQNRLSNTLTSYKSFNCNIITNEDKYIDRIEFKVYAKASKGNINNRNYGYDYIYSSWASSLVYLSNIKLNIQTEELSTISNVLKFRVGSNYLDILSQYTPLIDFSSGFRSGDRFLFDLWNGTSFVSLPNNLQEFTSTFTVSNPTVETNNAKLFIRFLDNGTYSYIKQFNVDFVYSDNSTDTIISNRFIHSSQDILESVPAGKIIKKITLSGTYIKNSNDISIGLIQIYNNVSTNETFNQYSAIYATSGDGQDLIMHFDCPDIEINQSGYVMLSKSNIYILPGTNVIYKQKSEPSSPHEGDVWLNYSEEPLNAYQYTNNQWVIFQDVPCGYVTIVYLNPSATITTSRQALTASVNASTFKNVVSSDGIYEFTYQSGWKLDNNSVTLSTYGITITSGSAQDGDILTVDFSNGDPTVSNLNIYPINQNGYTVNTFTDFSGALSGRDGRDGQNGKDGKNGSPGPQGPAGIGIPTGGLTGQILAKASNANYVTKWTNMISTALFDGGQAGQTLVKNSSEDLDFSWGTIEVLPTGGTSGQALVKDSNVDRDVSWQTLHEIPDGGIANQVLTKLSNNDQDVAWMNPGGGVSQASLDKMDFKTSMYFKASVDGYTNLLLEQFIGLDGVSTLDRANVLSYYSTIDCIINNTSGEDLVFRLIEMSFSQAINYMELEADYTGTVTFKYSLDSGETYVNFPEDQMIQTTVSTLIIKVEMANEATLSNIAIFTK